MATKTHREEMVEIIKKGGATIYKGTVYSQNNLSKLPSEAEMAEGDEVKTAAAKESLESQVEALQAELKKLESAPKATTKESKSEAEEETKAEAKAPTKSEKSEAKSAAKK